MARKVRYLGISLVVLGASAAAWLMFGGYPQERFAGYTVPRTVQYSFTVRNPGNEPVESARLSVYAPVERTARQRTEQVTANLPFEIRRDELGNQVLDFTFTDLGPFESRLVRIRAKLMMATAPARGFAQHLTDRFVSSETYIESDHGEVRQLAERLRRDNDARTVKAIYGWVQDNVEAQHYIAEDRGALYAVRQRRGDCTEMSYLTAALGRASGVPARVMGGYLASQDRVVHPGDFHNWAELYVDGAWRIVDPQRGVLRDRAADYVAVRTMASAQHSLLGSSHRFAYSDEAIEVVMD